MSATSVFEYLFPSRHRRSLLHLLVGQDRLTVRQLALKSGVAYSNAHREIGRLRRANLVRAVRDGTALRCSWNRKNRQAGTLESLIDPVSDEPDEGAVFSNLKRWHAPLSRPARSRRELPLEETLARALPLARRHPEVARAWPVVLARNLHRVDFDELERTARRLGEKQALGFLSALTAALLKNEPLRRRAARLKDSRMSKMHDFFLVDQSDRARRLAEENTPPSAREWRFRMNLPLESFESLFRKFVRTRVEG
jgi:DNA-binding transcriptional ArsR family regulator